MYCCQGYQLMTNPNKNEKCLYKENTTNSYVNGELLCREKLCTLKEYVQMERVKPGRKLLLGDVKDGVHSNTETIWIGDATPYHAPSTNDGGFGWDYNAPIMKKFVLEIHTYGKQEIL